MVLAASSTFSCPPLPNVAGRLAHSLALVALLLPYVGEGYVITYTDSVCTLPSYSDADLGALVERNCAWVAQGKRELELAVQKDLHVLLEGSGDQEIKWAEWGEHASDACRHALNGTDTWNYNFSEAAHIAVNAWGSIMAQGRECCTLLSPPYCLDQSVSGATVSLAVPVVFALALFAAAAMAACLVQPPIPKVPKAPESREREDKVDLDPPQSQKSALHVHLEEAWLRRSCLRVLPDMEHFARATASLMSSLQEAFQFQESSVKNQHEHLLSLWRSQVAMVADRAIGESSEVDESSLLKDALAGLHGELLDGFLRWRKVLCDCKEASVEERADVPLMCGVKWDMIPESVFYKRHGSSALEKVQATEEARIMSKQLAEVVVFLLVWGEAGNIRFMPELVYFITELVLASDRCNLKALYHLTESEYTTVTARQSGLFLAKIIRPLYNKIFDEWYEKVDVHKDSCKDVKKLHEGFDAYLPASVANYDDWNEFFCDPLRMANGLVQDDSTMLFEFPHSRRFKELSLVDWTVSLEAGASKTHRELHSLWGVFASTHRVWLAHAVLFLCSVCWVCGAPPERSDGDQPLGGRAMTTRFAAVGLLVPCHALAWRFAQLQVTGPVHRRTSSRCGPCKAIARSLMKPLCGCPGLGKKCLWSVLWEPPLALYLAPLATFYLLRAADKDGTGTQPSVQTLSLIHLVVSAYGLFVLLLVPGVRYNRFPFEPTPVPLRKRVLRYAFWIVVFAVKFALGLVVISAASDTINDLGIVRPGHQSWEEIRLVYYSAHWAGNILIWFLLWFTLFVFYIADTQLWFTIMCTFTGVATTFWQRTQAKNRDLLCACGNFMGEDAVSGCGSFMWEDAIAKIPQRFSQKVLNYTQVAQKRGSFPVQFPKIWDRIIEYMQYEDKLNNELTGRLSFDVVATGNRVGWEDLQRPVGARRGSQQHDQEMPSGDQKVRVPNIFKYKSFIERSLKTYCCLPDNELQMLRNPDVQWRILALARGLGLPMPRPYRAPYFPGLTVLIPHYGETILLQQKDLFQLGSNRTVPLMDWLKHRYEGEFENFTTRMQATGDWPVVGSEWQNYTDEQWVEISNWAAMRQQTLFRTVAGMCYYHPALQCHYDIQGDMTSALAQPGVWDVSDCFTCMVSMQMYKYFDKAMLDHTNFMLDRFPSCLKIAYIDCSDKGEAADNDGVHKMQKRRYYSCLIDKEHRPEPKYRIELPGFPILGDGKGDNQNHAIPFMRGHYAQCIDANQGAYFEQMLLLPCALGEFRSRRAGDGGGKRIVGLPEHITSDIGSIGDFAASAEVAFGSILQRTYAVLGARMHYGHPDIMNKLYMMQQGGVSKATKTLNLSEDIFAGMDFTLRGDGREIKHCEYFHLAKGRDMGFNTVLGFFSKLSSGTGEQMLTRQVFRLGQVLHLPEFLSFYYAHAGYYLTQFFVAWSLPLLTYVWLLTLLADCEGTFDAFQQCDPGRKSAAEVMATFLAMCYSWILLLFLCATSFPLFAELWMQRNLKHALWKMIQSLVTGSPFLFIFQAKCIGHYLVNELRYGGASYVATGRGLPTERRPFVGEPAPAEEGFAKMKKVGGLYLDYARISYYDGVLLLFLLACVVFAEGVSVGANRFTFVFVSLGLTITSWLYAPFIFNPYQFVPARLQEDARALLAFFFENNGNSWANWYDSTQLRPGYGLHQTVVDVSFFFAAFLLATLYTTVAVKMETLTSIYTEFEEYKKMYVTVLIPPVIASFLLVLLVVFVQTLLGCTSPIRRNMEARVAQMRSFVRKRHGSAGSPGNVDVEIAEVEEGRELEDFPSVAPRPTERQTRCCASLGTPLPIIAVSVLVLDVFESMWTLRHLWWADWRKATITALVLKLSLTTLMVLLGEGALRSKCFLWITGYCKPVGELLDTWVHAHRLARDLFTSLVIFLPLAVLTLINACNECLCPGFNCHQLCIYRDPGHIARTEVSLAGSKDQGFEGEWLKASPGAPLNATILGNSLILASGSSATITMKRPGKISTTVNSEVLDGNLDAWGQLVWNNGDVWVRKSAEVPKPRQMADSAEKAAALLPALLPEEAKPTQVPAVGEVERKVCFEDARGASCLFLVNLEEQVDFYFNGHDNRLVKTIENITCLAKRGNSLHVEGTSCSSFWESSWDINVKEPDDAERTVALFKREPFLQERKGLFGWGTGIF